MTLYQKFKRLKIDFYAIGLEQNDTKVTYFCTPKGAKSIGWAGVDGIHYCFVRGQGEMVFAVNPTNDVGRNVYPIASSFDELLSLLLACGSMAAIEQTHMWDEEQFDECLLFFNWNPEGLLRGKEAPVSLFQLEQGGAESFTGSPAGQDIPRLSGVADFEAMIFGVGYATAEPTEVVLTGVHSLQPWSSYFSPGNTGGARRPDTARGYLKDICEEYGASMDGVLYTFDDAWYEEHSFTLFLLRFGAAAVVFFATAVGLVLIGNRVFRLKRRE